jgi:hypothetical protein
VLRIAEQGRVENLAFPLLSYRAHEGSIGHRQAARQREALYLASRAAAERRRLPPPDPALRVLPEDERDSLESPAHSGHQVGLVGAREREQGHRTCTCPSCRVGRPAHQGRVARARVCPSRLLGVVVAAPELVRPRAL